MLTSLTVRDVVLIDRLALEFPAGLCVLTGETGAGKSILLDALGLALGVRAEARLVRAGADQAAVTAAFQVAPEASVLAELAEHGISPLDDAGGGAVILRRTLSADGRSRAFVNDEPVSVGLLKRVGEALVEIHGQFDNQRLLNPGQHRALLDAFGGLGTAAEACRRAWDAWQDAAAARTRAAEALAAARRDEDFLRHAAGELSVLAPEAGEEDRLARERAMMMHGEKVLEAMNRARAALGEGRGVEGGLQAALRDLEGVAEKAGGALEGVIAALGRALDEAAEAGALLERASQAVDLDPRRMETTEERLFALRAQARKHNVAVDALPALLAKMEAQLAALDTGSGELQRLEQAEAEARRAYIRAAGDLGKDRKAAAARLDDAIVTELAPLHLKGARFETRLTALDKDAWGPAGVEKAQFLIATNPGAEPGPLNKIASGGELARFMLALKVVLADADPVPTLIFDEVDAGIGGATAAAVGERLARLGGCCQVLVVTHSPQVAAQGASHLKVQKAAQDDGAATTVAVLDADARREEIARMLAGSEVTEEARAAALSLLDRRAS
ncbi:MAG: DNA repair protein RecN [Rhodospirillales bacterium CG15_BIG_FIL_POST_REV_8_21_14_020_66_15]|nr:MAG: DNA repair protein RecN [Rhodospirillales bacterium CG15_BIG_FIL_POST_REV_8_21_14_020_66_15]